MVATAVKNEKGIRHTFSEMNNLVDDFGGVIIDQIILTI